MPKKNLDVVITHLDGTPATGADGKPLLARTTLAQLLISYFEGYSPEKKLANGTLAFKLAGGVGEMEFTLDELKAMQDVAKASAPPLILKQLHDLLEG